MLTIWGRENSNNVRKVLWCAAELGLSYTHINAGGAFGKVNEESYRALNPNGLVPVLIDGERVLWESNTICRYLAGREGRCDLLPQEPGARAAVEMWMDWQATDLNGAWRYVFMSRVRGHADYQDAASLAAAEREWNRLMGLLDRHLAQHGPYAAGAAFTLADVVLGLSLNRWLMTPFERPDYAALAAYQQCLLQRPGYVQHGANGLP
ncbi:glutathione S-transferase [Serratia marcescens]|uniref:glutathione S-transferase family protein n=1 Tax=Serratia marcescens TaxID=615 RepID=UPI000F7E1C79|nr:glutathione S-transferase [Serratia marcescens]RTF16662.1 glutathione S-transferase [Serratia marcescens]